MVYDCGLVELVNLELRYRLDYGLGIHVQTEFANIGDFSISTGAGGGAGGYIFIFFVSFSQTLTIDSKFTFV